MRIFKYIWIGPWRVWVGRWRLGEWHSGELCGVFRNLPHVKPGRWGFFILALEIGSRQPGDPVGKWLIKKGIWKF